MKYLVKSTGKGSLKSRAHLWDEQNHDTYCRQWANHFLSKRYRLSNTAKGHKICRLCEHLHRNGYEVGFPWMKSTYKPDRKRAPR